MLEAFCQLFLRLEGARQLRLLRGTGDLWNSVELDQSLRDLGVCNRETIVATHESNIGTKQRQQLTKAVSPPVRSPFEQLLVHIIVVS